jgi:glycosyltransferase involved in cell wall biosynthesis
MSRRSGGLYLGAPAVDGIDVLREALELFPGARVALLEGASARERHQRMRAAAYLVVPALADDGGPRAVVEAFACGLPVIAGRAEPLVELVEPGRNGLLFEPGSARDLARRLAWAEAFPERMRRMGECAQADYNARFIAEWGWQRLYGDRRSRPRVSP